MLFLFVSALLGTVLCFFIMFMINYKYAALAVGKFLLIYIICILGFVSRGRIVRIPDKTMRYYLIRRDVYFFPSGVLF